MNHTNGKLTAARLQALSRAFAPIFTGEGGTTSELLLVRHAQPDYQAVAHNGDAGDPPLTHRGRQQALRLAARLRRTEVHAVYSSTMRRAAETANAVATAKGLPLTCLAGLREIEIDLAILQEGADLAPRELAERFISNPRWDALPGCEPSLNFRRRVVEAIESIAARHPGQRAVIVAHGGVINAYLSMVLDITRDMFFLPGHTSISTVLVHDNLYAVKNLNDMAHLPGAITTH